MRMAAISSSPAVAASEEARPAAIRRWAAWVASIVGVALAAWALVSSISGSPSASGPVLGAVVLVWAISGVVLSIRSPQEPLGFIALAGSAVAAAGGLSDWFQPVALALVPALGLHLLVGMPTGALYSRVRRTMLLLGYTVAVVVASFLWVARPDFPLWPAIVEAIVALLLGLSALVARYRTTDGIGQRRIKWLAWSIVVAGGLSIATLALDALVSWPDDVGRIATGATVLVPLALLAGTSRRLGGVIDSLLVRTILFGGLALVVAAVYVGVVLGLGRVPRESERTLLVLSMVAAGLATLLYFPAHARLERLAKRLVHGGRRAPSEAVRTFGAHMSRAVPLDELLLQLVESLRRFLGLVSAEVWTASGAELHVAVSDPDRARGSIPLAEAEAATLARAGVSGPAWAKVWLPGMLAGREDASLRLAPIVHSGELLGVLTVERAPDTLPFTPDEDRTLAELARQVGLTLHNVRLDSALQASLEEVRRQARELQASRSRIVAASDAARRRIERDLHDGAQQHLVALAVKTSLAKQFSERDPARANSILEELGADIQATVQELRDLAHGIYPPVLADKGLPEALTSAARRSTHSTDVLADRIGRYPPEIEAAVYFCCLEALQNAAKHAGEGAHAQVSVREEAGGLLFEVTDDGVGFDTRSKRTSAGFTNMNDRVGAIGGNLRVESTPGTGTRVSGVIPLPS